MGAMARSTGELIKHIMKKSCSKGIVSYLFCNCFNYNQQEMNCRVAKKHALSTSCNQRFARLLGRIFRNTNLSNNIGETNLEQNNGSKAIL